MLNLITFPVSVDMLKARLSHYSAAYVGWLSFDERSTALIRQLGTSVQGQILYFSFLESRHRNRKHKIQVSSTLRGAQVKFRELNREEQVLGFYHFQLELSNIIKSSKEIIIDLSAFPREYVCLIARLFYSEYVSISVSLIYNHAADYSYREDSEKKWLSIGARESRPVAGFSGSVIPGRPTMLIVLAGFDKDRVDNVAESLDPDVLVLGIPLSSDPNMQWLVNRIDAYAKQTRWRHMQVKIFKFDCNSFSNVTDNLQSITLENMSDFNIVFSPYNNKLSTLATASVALSLRKPQLVLAAANTYNYRSFAKPSERYSLLSFTRSKDY